MSPLDIGNLASGWLPRGFTNHRTKRTRDTKKQREVSRFERKLKLVRKQKRKISYQARRKNSLVKRRAA